MRKMTRGDRTHIRFGISIPNFGELASPDNIVRIAEEADELGYDSLWVAERLMVPEPPNQSWSKRDPTAFEPLVTLSHVAARTSNIGLGTSIVILPVRNPMLLARTAASVDVLSGGRLELGVGVGWMKEEMKISNVPFSERGRIADDYIEALMDIWQGRGHDGEYVQIPDNQFEPRPLNGGIPIWIGGNSDAALRRVASLGDGWVPMGSFSPGELKAKVETIRKRARRLDRDPAEISISCNIQFSLDDLKGGSAIDEIERYASSGASQILPRFDYSSASQLLEFMDQFASSILPSFR